MTGFKLWTSGFWKQPLYQLSHDPICFQIQKFRRLQRHAREGLPLARQSSRPNAVAKS